MSSPMNFLTKCYFYNIICEYFSPTYFFLEKSNHVAPSIIALFRIEIWHQAEFRNNIRGFKVKRTACFNFPEVFLELYPSVMCTRKGRIVLIPLIGRSALCTYIFVFQSSVWFEENVFTFLWNSFQWNQTILIYLYSQVISSL